MTIFGLEKCLDHVLGGEALLLGDEQPRPKRVVIEVDGSSTVSEICFDVLTKFFVKDFWSGRIWQKVPEIFERLAEKYDWRPLTVALTKSVSGHGKGEIDGAHKAVKRDIGRAMENLAHRDHQNRRHGFR